MDELRQTITEAKPKLVENSIKRYIGCLKQLYENIWKGKEFSHKRFFTDSKAVFDYFKNIPFNIRKTRISAILSISKGEPEDILEKYRTMMIDDCKSYNAHEKEHKMNPKERENWMTWDEIMAVHQTMEKKLKKQKDKNLYDMFEYLILSLYVLIKPRRSQDFTEMKINSYTKNDNYYDGKQFHFAVYKTAKKYGSQTIPVPPKLKSILDKWISMLHKGTEYLLTYQDRKLTVQRLTQLFNSIFKKGISVNVLRHAYITQELAPAIEKLEKIASEMGHSTAQQDLYIKKS
jgi:hypothetical protein